MRCSTGGRVLAAALCLVCIPGMICASTLRISWSPNTESDLGGYNIYYGNFPGYYDYILNVGNTSSVDISGFLEGCTYYIAVTAYDCSGNESGFSAESVISIPDADQGILTRIIEWLKDLIAGIRGSGSQLNRYRLKDFTGLGRAGVAASLGVVRAAGPGEAVSPVTADRSGYVIRDVLTGTGRPTDLSRLYPQGTYFFVPLTEGAPVIGNSAFYSPAAGAFLYMVTDEEGGPVEVVRVSVLESVTAAGEYESGSEMELEDIVLGVRLSLPHGAVEGGFTVGLGWSASEPCGAGFQYYNEDFVEFAVAPFGLVLSEPAEIEVLFDRADARVEYYDEKEKQWLPVDNVRVEDGYVIFQTDVLGRFKVYSIASGQGGPGSGGGGCFISCCGH